MWLASCQPTIAAREHVDDEAEVDHALPAADIGEVCDPEPIGPLRAEVALDAIGWPKGARIGPGGPPRLAAPLRALDPAGAHQPFDPVALKTLAAKYDSSVSKMGHDRDVARAAQSYPSQRHRGEGRKPLVATFGGIPLR